MKKKCGENQHLHGKPGQKSHSGGGQPRRAVYELGHGELTSLDGRCYDPITRPRNSTTDRSARAGIHILSIVQSVEGKTGSVPLEPAAGVHVVPHVGHHVHDPRVELPRTAQIRREAPLERLEIGRGQDPTGVDRDTSVLVRVLPVLGGYCVLLHVHGLSREDRAVLEDHGGVSEYEVDRAVDFAFAEELAVRVDVEGVLVPDDLASVDHCVVCPDPERYRLVLARPGPIHESNVAGDESRSGRGYQIK